MAISSVINLSIHCLFSVTLILASQVIFKSQMEYAIISFPVGENTFAWLFHAKKKTPAETGVDNERKVLFVFRFIF